MIEDDKLTIRSLKLFSVIIIAQLSQKPHEILGTIIVPILHIWKLKQSLRTSSFNFCMVLGKIGHAQR